MKAFVSTRPLGLLSVVALALAGIGAQSAGAGIVYSGTVNVPIPVSSSSTLTGLHIDIQGLTTRVASGSSISPEDLKLTANTASGSASFITVTSRAFSGNGAISFTNTTGFPPNIRNIPLNAAIGSSQTFATISGGTIGANAANLALFQNQSTFLGFRIATATANVFNYGWLRIQVGDDFRSATLVDFAYENQTNTTITAGAIPTPGAAVMLGLGAIASLRRRRRA
jgi:MYXO-CTERM domain-containing protein